MKFEIYPSITTTANWRELISEVKKLGLKEVCFFPTALNSQERQKAYKLLKKTQIKRLPLVHLRHDITQEEVEYFMEKYKTRIFNIHSQITSPFVLENDLNEFRKYIYLETTTRPMQKEPKDYAGICMDVSHVEDFRLAKSPVYQGFLKDLANYPVGVAHISAVSQKSALRRKLKIFPYSKHFFDSLAEFDYVKRYQKYLPKMIALELENSISDQFQAIGYLEKLLKNED